MAAGWDSRDEEGAEVLAVVPYVRATAIFSFLISSAFDGFSFGSSSMPDSLLAIFLSKDFNCR